MTRAPSSPNWRLPAKQTAVGSLAAAITALESNPVPGGLSGLSEQMFDTASRYMPFGSRLLFANRWLFGPVVEAQLSSVTFSNAMLRTTTAPTMLSGSVKSNDASPVSSWESAGYQTVAQSVREIYGDVVVTPGLMIAASDSRHYGTVADNAYRFNPFTVSQADMTGFHGTNEKISLASLVQGARTYVRILQLGSSK